MNKYVNYVDNVEIWYIYGMIKHFFLFSRDRERGGIGWGRPRLPPEGGGGGGGGETWPCTKSREGKAEDQAASHKKAPGGGECLKTVNKIKARTIRNPDNVNISKRYADCNDERRHVALCAITYKTWNTFWVCKPLHIRLAIFFRYEHITFFFVYWCSLFI